MRMRESHVGREWTALMSCKGGNARSGSGDLREVAHYERGEGS